MRTTAKERAEVVARLVQLGISYPDAEALRRIAKTLHRWHELECGTGDDRVTRSIEREGGSDDGKPYLRTQYQSQSFGWIDNRRTIPDREAGAKKRLAAIMANYKRKLVPYIQGDPRGASLYICRKSDVNGHELDSVYSRGVAVY